VHAFFFVSVKEIFETYILLLDGSLSVMGCVVRTEHGSQLRLYLDYLTTKMLDFLKRKPSFSVAIHSISGDGFRVSSTQ